MARKRHYMTPKRRAALRKAQAASARKRRRKQITKRVGVGVGVFAGAVLSRQMNKVADNPFTYIKRTKRDYQESKSELRKFKNGMRRRFTKKRKALPAGSLNFTIQSGPWV